MDVGEALDWARRHSNGVLITIRADGRPQSSDIVYVVDGDRFVISVTDDRAKTRNMRRDARVVLHVTSPEEWSYAAFDGIAELSPVASDVDDATCDALCAYYRAARGEDHPDWDDYRRAMVADKRLVVTVRPTSAVGIVR
jgi:PPOX class probable F420-dependent enzyme